MSSPGGEAAVSERWPEQPAQLIEGVVAREGPIAFDGTGQIQGLFRLGPKFGRCRAAAVVVLQPSGQEWRTSF